MWATLIPTQCLKPPCPYYFLGCGAGGSTVLVSTVKFSTNYLVSCLFSKWESNYCLRRAEMMGASCWGHSNERNCVGLLCDSFCLRAHVLLGSLFFAFHTLVSRSLVGQGTAHKTRKSYVSPLPWILSQKSWISSSPWILCQKNISITIAMDSLSKKKASASPSPWVHCQKILPLPWAPVTAQLPGADRPKLAIGQWYLSLWDCLALTDQNVYHKKMTVTPATTCFCWKWRKRSETKKDQTTYSWQFVSAEIGGKNSETEKVFTITCFGRNWRVSDAKKRPDSWSQFSAKSSGCHPTFFCTLRSPGFRRNWRISIEKTQN